MAARESFQYYLGGGESGAGEVEELYESEDEDEDRLSSFLNFDVTSDAAVARTLLRNPRATKVGFCIGAHSGPQGDWNETCEALSAMSNLEYLVYEAHGNRWISPAPSFCHQTLQILPASSSLRSLSLSSVHRLHADDLANIFRSQQSVLTRLGIFGCDRILGNTERLVAAIQNNETIQYLKLEVENQVLKPFVYGLKSNKTLINLSVDLVRVPFDETTFSAVKELFSCTAVDKLTCYGMPSDSPLLEELAKNDIPTNIEIHFFDEVELAPEEMTAAAELFKQFVTTKANLRRLYLDPDAANDNPGFVRALCQALTLSDSSLRCVEFGGDYNQFGGGNLDQFIKAVGNSSLEYLDMGYLGEYAQIFFQGIASLTLPKLKFQILDPRSEQVNGWLEDLRTGLSNNFTLQELNFELLFALTDDEQRELDALLRRNKFLRTWIANPETVPRAIRSEVIQLAAKAGEFSLVADLLVPLLDEECLERMRTFSVSDNFKSHCTSTLFHGDDEFCSRAVTAYHQFLKLKRMYKDTVGPFLVPSVAVDKLWKEHEVFLDGAEYAAACIPFFGNRLGNSTDDAPLSLSARAQYIDITKSLIKTTFGDADGDCDIWLDFGGILK